MVASQALSQPYDYSGASEAIHLKLHSYSLERKETCFGSVSEIILHYWDVHVNETTLTQKSTNSLGWSASSNRSIWIYKFVLTLRPEQMTDIFSEDILKAFSWMKIKAFCFTYNVQMLTDVYLILSYLNLKFVFRSPILSQVINDFIINDKLLHTSW